MHASTFHLIEGPCATAREWCQSFIEQHYPNNIPPVDAIVWLRPLENGYKKNQLDIVTQALSFARSSKTPLIIVLEEAHRIPDRVTHIFLKTLEELPDHSYVIFTTNSPEHLLPTLKSRALHEKVEGEDPLHPLLSALLHAEILPHVFDAVLNEHLPSEEQTQKLVLKLIKELVARHKVDSDMVFNLLALIEVPLLSTTVPLVWRALYVLTRKRY